MKKRFLLIIFSFIFLITSLYINHMFFSEFNNLKVINATYENDFLNVYLNTKNKYLKCSISKDNNRVYKRLNGNVCSFKIKKGYNYKLYLKYYDKILKVNYKNTILNSEISYNKLYLAVGEKKKINSSITSLSTNSISFKSEDNDIVKINGDTISALKSGKTYIYLEHDQNSKIEVFVSNLIVRAPKKYNYNKQIITCGKYSYDEERELDLFLKNRIKEKGYGTRAGVVEAARFITLNFPYSIPYFSENGRLTVNGVDGEGRFYHKGLYLTDNKYKLISKSDKGPAPWGCQLYSRPSKAYRKNGLDCSGFTTWVLFNGGFEPGDWGAKGKYSNEINNFGDEVYLNEENSSSLKIKAGDLLGEVSVSEGHSAIIVGIDDMYYYVAESLWISPLGVNVNKYRKDLLYKHFETVNLMDSYYKEDGLYTDMWY